MSSLEDFGWTDFFAQAWNDVALDGCTPARVIADFGSVLKIAMPELRQAEFSGRLSYASTSAELPKVGDWVAARRIGDTEAIIEAVLPRRNDISRKVPGEKVAKQILATNIDIALVMQSLDEDFSPSRLDRYVYQLKNQHISSVLLLNKADQVPDVQPFLSQLTAIDMSYIVCSAHTGLGLDKILACIQPRKTAVLLGSSGVGKSTLTNLLLGSAVQKTQSVREEDQTGRHTTTHREIFVLQNGGLLIDSPGIRELQLWGPDDELVDTFEDIAELMDSCKFRNCGHTTEPGCAIRTALQDGSLTVVRYNNYLKMKQELAYLKSKSDPVAAMQKKKALSKVIKQHYKETRNMPKYDR